MNNIYTVVDLVDQHPTTAQVVELRLQRTKDHFTALWREPGQPWQEEGETDVHFNSTMGGLDVLATVNAPQTTAQYDYFRVSCG